MTDSAPPDTLCGRAVAILLQAEPEKKAELTLKTAEEWRGGLLEVDHLMMLATGTETGQLPLSS